MQNHKWFVNMSIIKLLYEITQLNDRINPDTSFKYKNCLVDNIRYKIKLDVLQIEIQNQSDNEKNKDAGMNTDIKNF